MNVGILAHLLDFRPGYRQAGVSRYIEHLIQELPSASPDRFVVYGGWQSRTPRQQFTHRSGIRFSSSWVPTGRPEMRIFWEQVAAPIVLDRDQIDVVHAPVNVAPALAHRPVVVTVHDLAFLRFPEQYPRFKQRYLSLMTRHSVRHAARVIAVSNSTRNDLVHYYGVSSERVSVVPNGVDPTLRPIDGNEIAEFRRARSLPEQFILFLGTLQPRKNLIALLRAWSKLDPSERLPLVVVGSQGWMYEPIYGEARALGVAGEVVFKGFAEPSELAGWYSAATIFVYPSLYEGFGLPVLEAMRCGTPVIASNVSSLPEVAGDAALLVDPTDVGALSDAIERLTLDSELRADLARRGLEWSGRFSWARTARETANVYRLAAKHKA